jgi:hypothetical protein
MNWKEFLKRDPKKMIIVTILGYFSYLYGLDFCYMPPCPEGMGCVQVCGYRANPFLWGPGFIFFGHGEAKLISLIILGIIYWYLISCLIVWIYDRLKKKK